MARREGRARKPEVHRTVKTVLFYNPDFFILGGREGWWGGGNWFEEARKEEGERSKGTAELVRRPRRPERLIKCVF